MYCVCTCVPGFFLFLFGCTFSMGAKIICWQGEQQMKWFHRRKKKTATLQPLNSASITPQCIKG